MLETYQVEAETPLGIRFEHEVFVVEGRICKYQLCLQVCSRGLYVPGLEWDDLGGGVSEMTEMRNFVGLLEKIYIPG